MRSAFAVLPVDGEMHLCLITGCEFEPLVKVPGTPDASYALSDDGVWLSILDDKKRRAALYECLQAPPWLAEQLPFVRLPTGCVGHVSLGWDGQVLVGGHGEAGEAMWQRAPDAPHSWREIPLPKGVRRRGKAIDGLHVIGDSLLAVDDIVLPKWLLDYALPLTNAPQLKRKAALPRHTSYERITDTSLGPHGLAMLSSGVNHGTPSKHMCCLDLATFKPRAYWGARGPASISPDPDPSWFCLLPGGGLDEDRPSSERRLAKALLGASAIAQTGQAILLACGSEGILVIRPEAGEPHRHADQIEQLSIAPLASVHRFALPQPNDGSGVFAIGKALDGSPLAVWVDVS